MYSQKVANVAVTFALRKSCNYFYGLLKAPDPLVTNLACPLLDGILENRLNKRDEVVLFVC